MKSIGIVRKIDSLGRIVIPKELRDVLNINYDSYLEIYVEKNKIIMSKYKKQCYLCNSELNLIEFKNKNICMKCIRELL